MIRFVSCLGFGGAFDLGATQAGMTMVGRKELKRGYGALNILGNRHILGSDWDTDLSMLGDGSDWDVLDAEVVLGNPPCSGFSTLSSKSFRGQDSKINDCMWALARYAGRVKPEVVVFESVQQAFTQGRDLMAKLRAEIESISGLQYGLWHVLHNNYSLGGCSIRRRYFFVASRVPFGVERVKLDMLPVISDAFDDLEPLGLTWERQPYRSPPTWWSAQMRDGTETVDGHMIVDTPQWQRVLELITGPRAVEWNPGEILSTICMRYYDRHGDLPKSWQYEATTTLTGDDGLPVLDETTGKPVRIKLPKAEVLVKTGFNMGFNQLVRWHAGRPGRVITGGGCQQVLHPTQLRPITHREAARVQGFPDVWKVRPLRGVPELQSTWGKGIPVHSGRWVASAIASSINGEPGSYIGDLVPHKIDNCAADHHDREWVIDVTDDWRALEPDKADKADTSKQS